MEEKIARELQVIHEGTSAAKDKSTKEKENIMKSAAGHIDVVADDGSMELRFVDDSTVVEAIKTSEITPRAGVIAPEPEAQIIIPKEKTMESNVKPTKEEAKEIQAVAVEIRRCAHLNKGVEHSQLLIEYLDHPEAMSLAKAALADCKLGPIGPKSNPKCVQRYQEGVSRFRRIDTFLSSVAPEGGKDKVKTIKLSKDIKSTTKVSEENTDTKSTTEEVKDNSTKGKPTTKENKTMQSKEETTKAAEQLKTEAEEVITIDADCKEASIPTKETPVETTEATKEAKATKANKEKPSKEAEPIEDVKELTTKEMATHIVANPRKDNIYPLILRLCRGDAGVGGDVRRTIRDYYHFSIQPYSEAPARKMEYGKIARRVDALLNIPSRNATKPKKKTTNRNATKEEAAIPTKATRAKSTNTKGAKTKATRGAKVLVKAEETFDFFIDAGVVVGDKLVDGAVVGTARGFNNFLNSLFSARRIVQEGSVMRVEAEVADIGWQERKAAAADARSTLRLAKFQAKVSRREARRLLRASTKAMARQIVPEDLS